MDNLNNLYVPVRERIFTLLQAKALSQKEFAEAIGVSAETVSAWKAGRNFSFSNSDKLTIIAQVLGTTPAELLGEEKPTPVSRDGLDEEELDLLRRFQSATPALRAAALAVLKSGEEQGDAPDAASSGE